MRPKKTEFIIMTATSSEGALLTAMLSCRREVRAGRFGALSGLLEGRRVLLFHAGVGKANAAHGATLLLENYSTDLMLMIGCGGAYRKSGLAPGSLAVAGSEIFGDEGAITPEGWKSMKELGFPLYVRGVKKFYNTISLDRRLVRKASKILSVFTPCSGPFVTVSEVSGTDERAAEMERRFSGICENMEGAPVAYLCALYDVPFLELRGISNIVKKRDRKEWDLESAMTVSQHAALKLIKEWPKR
jgi:futalosine hydrolase